MSCFFACLTVMSCCMSHKKDIIDVIVVHSWTMIIMPPPMFNDRSNVPINSHYNWDLGLRYHFTYSHEGTVNICKVMFNHKAHIY